MEERVEVFLGLIELGGIHSPNTKQLSANDPIKTNAPGNPVPRLLSTGKAISSSGGN